MLAIFSFSTDILSAQHTSRVIGPFLRWLNPDVSERTIQLVQTIVRKSGHVVEYAILAILFRRAFSQFIKNNSRLAWWRQTGWSLLAAILYAVTDEYHQSFVPSRWASPWDVLIDSLGAALGLAILCLTGWGRE
jgi:VanZ family protein